MKALIRPVVILFIMAALSLYAEEAPEKNSPPASENELGENDFWERSLKLAESYKKLSDEEYKAKKKAADEFYEKTRKEWMALLRLRTPEYVAEQRKTEAGGLADFRRAFNMEQKLLEAELDCQLLFLSRKDSEFARKNVSVLRSKINTMEMQRRTPGPPLFYIKDEWQKWTYIGDGKFLMTSLKMPSEEKKK